MIIKQEVEEVGDKSVSPVNKSRSSLIMRVNDQHDKKDAPSLVIKSKIFKNSNKISDGIQVENQESERERMVQPAI